MNSGQKQAVVLVTGLSGAGKSSILRTLEDLGFETMDNPPLAVLEDLVTRGDRNLAIGVDARSRGFGAAAILCTLERLRANPALRPALVFATAEDDILLRRYSETRRRHPLAQDGKVADGIALERRLTEPLAASADLLVDTSALPMSALRQMVEKQFGAGAPGLGVSLVSFAFPAGLPRDADLVFDARFLRNPYYDERLRPLTGLDAEIGTFIEQDADFVAFYAHLHGFVDFLLPRFVQEGKKYATIAIGCTGGQHRSVYLVEKLAAHLNGAGWRVGVTHREAAKFSASGIGNAGRRQVINVKE
jgi:UPF0042 nucleotide-binding protein